MIRLLLLAGALLLAGCDLSNPRWQPAPPAFGEPLIERLPLRVAWRYAADVDRDTVAAENGKPPVRRDPMYHHFLLGPATRATFDRVLRAQFAASGSGPPDGTIETTWSGSTRSPQGTSRRS